MEIDEIPLYLKSLQKRIAHGEVYCTTHPCEPNSKKLLTELRYREVWTSRLLSYLTRLSTDTEFGTAAYITSPFGQVVNMISVMFGTPSGTENENYILALAAHITSSKECCEIEHFLLVTFNELERKLHEFNEKSSFTPDELYKSIVDFAVFGFNAWLNFRTVTTNIN